MVIIIYVSANNAIHFLSSSLSVLPTVQPPPSSGGVGVGLVIGVVIAATVIIGLIAMVIVMVLLFARLSQSHSTTQTVVGIHATSE